MNLLSQSFQDMGKAVPEKTKEVRGELSHAFKEFCEQTTAHGLPMVSFPHFLALLPFSASV